MIKKLLFGAFCLSSFLAIAGNHESQDSTSKNRGDYLFRVGGNIGLSKRMGRIADIPTGMEFFYNDLKIGGLRQLYIDYGKFNKMNIGFYVNQFQVRKALPNVSFVDSLNKVSQGTYSDDIRIHSYLIRLSSKKFIGEGESIVAWSSLGAGLGFYTQESQRADLNYSYKGKTILFGASLGVDVFLTKQFAIGGELAFSYGKIGRVTFDDGLVTSELVFKEVENINISKLDFGIGCRYYF